MFQTEVSDPDPEFLSSAGKPSSPGALYRMHMWLWVMEEMFSRFSVTYSPNSKSLELET